MESTPESLKLLYEKELEFRRAREEIGDPREPEAAAMLAASRRMDAGRLPEGTDAGTWIWSDLHLGQWEAPAVYNRPFSTSVEMDNALLEAWYSVVGDNDVVIWLGDIGMNQNSGPGLDRLRGAPGWKILVIGNHDCGQDGTVDADWADEIYSTIYAGGDPPLLMTHVPLIHVPEKCVNVHGHTHKSGPAADGRRINVCVEQIEYRPAGLEQVRALAKHLAKGEIPNGATTGELLKTRADRN